MSFRLSALVSLVLVAGILLVIDLPHPAGQEVESDTPTADARPVKNWIGWDREISRSIARLWRRQMAWVDDPADLYRQEVRYRAEVDSIGLVDWRALPAAEQQERRRLAQDFRNRADRFRSIVTILVEHYRNKMTPLHPHSVTEGMARFLGALLNANGIDPSDPESWYDLSFGYGATGDLPRQRIALEAAVAVIGDDPGGRFRKLWHRLALDQAWLCRETGRFAEGIAWLDRADAREAAGEESLLIRGLLLAEMGESSEAFRLAEEVRSIRIHVPSWGWLPSDFAKRWIQSTAYRVEGEMALAAFVLGRIHTSYEIPYAWRYYNDVGLMCELNGQLKQAREYYGLAMVYRPFFVYFPILSFAGPARVLGQPGSHFPYSLAYGRYFVAGSLYSFAAHQVISCGAEEDPVRKQELGREAIAALDVCRSRGIRPVAALALRGRVHFQLGEFDLAAADLAAACDQLAQAGVSDPEVCALAGLLEVEQDDYSQALPHLARAIRVRPEKGQAWNALGVAAIYEGDNVTGRKAFDTAIDLSPDSPAGWYNRGLLGFHQRDWDAACADLEAARNLAPANPEILALLERARRARDLAPDPGANEGGDGGRGSPTAKPVDLEAKLDFWSGVFPESYAFDDQIEPDAVATMYSDEPFVVLDPRPDRPGRARLDLSAEDLQRVAKVLEENYGADPTRANRRDLALAYVRAGFSRKGRDLLLPLWGKDIQLDEMCVVLEADRALGDVARAVELAGSLADGPPEVEDPIFWSLVAFVCLDGGLNEPGLAALDAAIAFDPDNQALKNQRQFLTGRPR